MEVIPQSPRELVAEGDLESDLLNPKPGGPSQQHLSAPALEKCIKYISTHLPSWIIRISELNHKEADGGEEDEK